MLPIVGALFHCPICENVDICQNCEAAGLPGDLNSAEGGHNSSHILLKVRFSFLEVTVALACPIFIDTIHYASRQTSECEQSSDASVAKSRRRGCDFIISCLGSKRRHVCPDSDPGSENHTDASGDPRRSPNTMQPLWADDLWDEVSVRTLSILSHRIQPGKYN